MVPTQRPPKDDYFLGIAGAVSQRSTCLRRKFGAILVTKEGVICGAGYAGSAVGVVNCDSYGHCLRDLKDKPQYSDYSDCISVHSEENCVINSNRDDRIGATMYVVGFDSEGRLAPSYPCQRCKRIIINSRISRVVTRDEDGSIVSYDPETWKKEDSDWYVSEVEKALRDILIEEVK